MKRRYVVVPKSFEAETRLNHGDERDKDLLEVILTEKDYLYLEGRLFFDNINELLQTNIDDYEDEVVRGEENIKKILRLIDLLSEDGNQRSLISKLRVLFKEALSNQTGVYFFF